jgi:hypothetical protein
MPGTSQQCSTTTHVGLPTGYEGYPSRFTGFDEANNQHFWRNAYRSQPQNRLGAPASCPAPALLASRHLNPNVNSGSDGRHFEHRINRRSMASGLGDYAQGWPVNNSVAQHQSSNQAAASHLEAREGPAPSQWQAVKDEIIFLYEKSPLRDVRSIMERKGFRA